MRAVMALVVVGTFLIGRAADAQEPAPVNSFAYVGTYERGGGRGIYLFEFASGERPSLTPRGLAAELPNASFLAVDAKRQLLFAVGESGTGGSVSAFSFDPKDGKLTALNRQSSGGSGPCHLALAPDGSHVVVANYGGGSVAVLPIGDDGRLGEASDVEQHAGSGPNAQRQEGPHAHCVTFSPDGSRVFVCDLGIDKVMIYKFDAEAGTLTANDPPFAALAPGAGPRHMAFSVEGRFAYVLNELDGSVAMIQYDAESGALASIGTATTLPKGYGGANTNAEIAVHPSGKFLYTSNRGTDTIAIFTIDRTTGVLTPLAHVPTGGKTPRHFAIDPSGEVLLAENQSSGTITMFRIAAATGELTRTGELETVPSPVCLVFLSQSK